MAAMVLLLWYTVALGFVILAMILVMVGSAVAIAEVEVDLVVVVFVAAIALVHVCVLLSVVVAILLVRFLRCWVIAIISGGRWGGSRLLHGCLGLLRGFVIVVPGFVSQVSRSKEHRVLTNRRRGRLRSSLVLSCCRFGAERVTAWSCPLREGYCLVLLVTRLVSSC